MPNLAHFFRTFQVEVTCIKPEALWVIHRGSCTNTQQHIVRICVSSAHIVQVIGCDKWKFQGLGNLHQIKAELRFNLQPVIHHFAEVVARSENVSVVGGSSKSLLVLACLQPTINFATWATGSTD